MTEGDTAAALNTSGQLTITDPDAGEAHVVAQTNAHGTYGDFSIDANGAWTYTGNGAHNELTAGQQVSDSFTVTSQDGTATGMVTVTITGTNDAATVSSASKSVTEGDTAAALNTSGPLTITDPDAGEAHVVAQTNAHGTYGDFSIDANGAWTYTGNDAAQRADRRPAGAGSVHRHQPGRHRDRHRDGDAHRHQRRRHGVLRTRSP